MKLKLIFATGASLIAIFISSCSGPISAPPTSDTSNKVTGGLRSGDLAISRNSIDAMLNNPQPQATENIDAILNNPNPSKKQKERPGLATGWGEEKTSVMSDTGFTRASKKPAGVDVIYYNDSEGLKAMAPGKDKIAALRTVAGNMVEWGIKGSFGYLPTYNEGYMCNTVTNKRYVMGKHDRTYSIVVKNRSKSALEIVASVDGLDVQDGKPASYSKRGYIVPAGETVEISGFRTSPTKVAAFKFSTVTNSYANMRHGETTNVGVIGIAVFTEKNVDPWTWMPEEVTKRKNASPFAVAP
jgi:hypothetical protein